MTPYPFRHQLVQELAWVIQSPPLISGLINTVKWWDSYHCEEEYQACLPVLQQLDKDPLPLNQYLKEQNKRLGKRFETLVAYWFSISPNYQIIEQNYVLREGKHTLGEMDFLLLYKPKQSVIHLEVAVKFYLGIDELNSMSHWYGPALIDRLDKKFKRLAEHQTQLSRKHPHLMPANIDQKACLLKGRFFYPYNNSIKIPNFAADHHSQGYFLETPHSLNPEQLTYLPKWQWLHPIPINSTQSIATIATPNPLNEPHCYELHDSNTTQRLLLLPKGFLKKARGLTAQLT